jgi:hypothetical protein
VKPADDDRDARGRFKKGRGAGSPSPNPGGRPRIAAHVRELARERTPEIVERLMAIIQRGNAQESTEAARLLLSYGYGKPADAHLIATLDATAGLSGGMPSDGGVRPFGHGGVIFLPVASDPREKPPRPAPSIDAEIVDDCTRVDANQLSEPETLESPDPQSGTEIPSDPEPPSPVFRQIWKARQQ